MALRKSIIKRFVVIYIIVVIGFLAAIGRMISIMTLERNSWLELAEKAEGGTLDSRKTKEVKPERGNILSDGEGLITATIPYYNTYIDMKVSPLLKDGGALYKQNVDSLSICLSRMFGDKSPAAYRTMLDKGYFKQSRRWKISPRKVSYLELLEMKTFPILRERKYTGGFYYIVAPVRENLYGSLASRTIGNINIEGHGRFGLEAHYDSLLSGDKGEAIGYRSGKKWIYVLDKKAERGADVVTTLDLEMQEICEVALREKMKVVKAKNACVVLMEVKTGEIKAMVNLYKTKGGEYIEGWNMAVADMSEPGSTFKTMSLMVALDSNICDTSDIYDIGHGKWNFYKSEMTDHNWKKGGYDSLTVSQILANSSNVGVSRIIDEYYNEKPQSFIDAVKETKFAENINIQIPGAAAPKFLEPGDKGWSKLSLPWMSIGYVALVPPIYTLKFYNAIANDGKMMQPYLVKEVRKGNKVIESYSPEIVNASICKKSTVKKLQGMLEGVVENGTAKSIKSKVFKIAGKTGTAQLNYGTGGVIHHQVSFCGYFPADDPLYSCIVVVKEPQMAPAAAFISGEVFKKAAERIYAQRVKRNISDLERWKVDSIHKNNLPRIKGGKKKIVVKAMDQLGINYGKQDADWVSLNSGVDNQVIMQNRPMLDNLVPNVIGMGATDAVYLLEQRGMYVQIYGKGRVVQQSKKPGEKVIKGKTITLVLR